MRPEAEDEQQIEALIAEQVHQKLQVILEGEMANALHDFVDKASLLQGPGCSVPCSTTGWTEHCSNDNVHKAAADS